MAKTKNGKKKVYVHSHTKKVKGKPVKVKPHLPHICIIKYLTTLKRTRQGVWIPYRVWVFYSCVDKII